MGSGSSNVYIYICLFSMASQTVGLERPRFGIQRQLGPRRNMGWVVSATEGYHFLNYYIKGRVKSTQISPLLSVSSNLARRLVVLP